MKHSNPLGGCANCGALTSPCWRKGPEEARHLCNACGSRYLVKGTLEGYKPGLKSRSGGKRSKSGKSKPFPGSAYTRGGAESPQKRLRLFKERAYVDKAVQVNPVELQCMQPFSRSLSADDGSDVAYLNDSSPKSHFDRIKQENSPGYHMEDGHELKDSSDESTPDGDPNSMVARRRARKPCRPQVSTW